MLDWLLKEPRWAIRAAAAFAAMAALIASGWLDERYLPLDGLGLALLALGLYTAARWGVTLLAVAMAADRGRRKEGGGGGRAQAAPASQEER